MINKNLMQAAENKSRLADVTGLANPTLSSLAFLVLFVITLGWLGDTLLIFLNTFLGVDHHFWRKLAVGVLPFMLLVCVGWLRWKLAQRKRVKLKIQASEITPHAGMTLFLSSINKSQNIERLEKSDWDVLDAKNFSWKPVQRGMEAHRQRLNSVWVICSPESGEQYEWFESMFQKLYPNVSFIRQNVSSFEDISALTQTLEEILADLPKDMDESDVVIDITGGQKPASIAGMMVSLVNENRQAQYVQTNAPFDVKTYDYEIKTVGRGIVSQ